MKRLSFVFTILSLLAIVFSSVPVLAAPAEKVDVLIGFSQPPGQAERALIRSLGGDIKYTYSIIPTIAAAVPENAIAGLRNNPRVTHVNLDVEVHAIAGETIPWGVDKIDADVVQAGGNKGNGVKVAIIDTGIDKDHPDLQANIKGGVNFVGRLLWFDPDPTAWDDDNGHGSHVAGIVAAVDNEIGYVGVAPEAYLYGVKVLDKNGSGYLSAVIAGINWAVTNDMQVINMSLGSSTSDPDLEAACNAAYAAGIVVVAAAGNSGDDGNATDDDVNYPGKYASVIAVAATDSNNLRPSWSSDGPEVELAAPGVSIPSTYKNGGYATYSGTSMASPHVAGVAALVIKSNTVNNGNGLYGIADEVRARMDSTADPLGNANWYGNGLVDADEAAAGGPVNQSPVAEAGPDRTATVGPAVTFDGSGSSDSDGSIVSYSWNFGDTTTATGITVTHSYSASGIYTVTLTVTDNGGSSGTDTAKVTVTEPTSSGVMHVASIDMGLKKAGKNTAAVATVTIKDINNAVVPGSTVYGAWSGPGSGFATGVTDSSGKAILQSGYVRNAKSGTTFYFTVINVELKGWTYDQSLNVETGDFITIVP